MKVITHIFIYSLYSDEQKANVGIFGFDLKKPNKYV